MRLSVVFHTGEHNDPQVRRKEAFLPTSFFNRLVPRTLQKRMVLLVLGLMLFVILLTGGIFSNFLSGVIEEEIGQKALMVSESVASIPEIRTALQTGDPEGRIQQLAEEIRVKTGAEFVVVGDRQGRRYSHPDPEKLGKHMVGGDNRRALEEGKAYVSKAIGTLGPSIRGKTPVFSSRGEVIGVVSVGYLLEDVNAIIHQAQLRVIPFLVLVLMLGGAGAVQIAKTFKNAIFGLEPEEIAGILQERTAILEAIRSGMVATDNQLRINLVNNNALKTLGRSTAEELIGQPMASIFPEVPVATALEGGERLLDREYLVDGTRMIFNLIPIRQSQGITGLLATFRRKDEIDVLARELSSAKLYADTLRAQTHEYANKLHTIAGLIQLESYDEALELIVQEDNHFKDFVSLVTRVSQDPVVSALILGKLSYAHEVRVDFLLDPQSRMASLPEDFPSEKLVTIIGNLLDNAFEAAREGNSANRWVRLRLDGGERQLTVRIEDSGRGIPAELARQIFQRGVSSKGQPERGVGLYLVAKCVDELKGEIHLEQGSEGGAVFTATLPLTARG